MSKSFYFMLFYLLMCTIDSFSFSTTEKVTKSKDSVQILFEKGITKYGASNYLGAASSWKALLELPSTAKLEKMRTNVTSNIGACYNALGYSKTALLYFFKTKKLLDKDVVKKENYWINTLNIGVCYNSLQQPALAKQYFDATENFNEHVILLKNMNWAKWYADKNQKAAFFKYKEIVDKDIAKFDVYKDAWIEMELQILTDWKKLSYLKILLNQLDESYINQNVSIKIAYYRAYFLLNNKLPKSIEIIKSFENEIKAHDNFNLKESYYRLISNYYLQQKNISEYARFTILLQKNSEAMYLQKSTKYINDTKAAQDIEELKGKYESEKLNNELINSQLIQNKLKLYGVIFVLALSFVIIYLLFKTYKYHQKINELMKIKSLTRARLNERNQSKLSANLKLSEEELNSTMTNIKKIKLLKKQLYGILKDEKFSDKDAILQIKNTLNSFFVNYRELSTLINKKVNIDKIASHLRENFDTITDRDLQILEYILLKYTTKEISMLIEKSEKSVEYYRTQIRKKLELTSEVSLEVYLSSLNIEGAVY